jgi:hypothetical protein
MSGGPVRPQSSPQAAKLARPRRTPREWLYRTCVTFFVVFHVASICWWLIPANGYPSDALTWKVPPWLSDREDATFAWKRANAQHWLARCMEDYLFLTASWQRWWLFAPNPINYDDWITAYAVTGWREPDVNDPNLEKEPLLPWNNRRKPIYDPEPIYQSYPGKLEDSIHGHAGIFRHDAKLVENLTSGNWDEPLGAFAQWCGAQYRQRTGHAPLLGVHIILHRGEIPRGFERQPIASQHVSERVLWYLHY